MLFVVDLSTYT